MNSRHKIDIILYYFQHKIIENLRELETARGLIELDGFNWSKCFIIPYS